MYIIIIIEKGEVIKVDYYNFNNNLNELYQGIYMGDSYIIPPNNISPGSKLNEVLNVLYTIPLILLSFIKLKDD